MTSRVVTACVAAVLVFAAPFTLVGAKPPDLPVGDVEFRDSTPEPVPFQVATPPVKTGTAPVPATAPQPVPITVTVHPAVRVAAPAMPRAISPSYTYTSAPCMTVMCASEAAAPKMVTKVYPVADLVIPLEKGQVGKTTEDRLLKLIAGTVAPASWAAKGGAGTMDYYPQTLSVVINQPPDIQERIADLLASLRKMQDTEVAVDVRFVCVAEDFWKDTFSKCEACATKPIKSCPASEKCPAAKADSAEVRFLNDIQVFQLMEAAQEDRRTNVMQTPKITMFNGQTSNISVNDQQFFNTKVEILYGPNGSPIFVPKTEQIEFGTKMSLLPIISADKRFVRLNVNASLTSQDSDVVPLIPIKLPLQEKSGSAGKAVEFTQFLHVPSVTTLCADKTFTLPDGGSALVNMGSRQHEVAGDWWFFPVPPHMETEHVLMLVTPRIIVDEAAETHVAKAMPPADAEEQEEPASAKKCANCCDKCPDCCQSCCKKCRDCCENCAKCCHGKATELVEKYQRACAEGHGDMATKLAVQALAIDPMCFSKSRTVPSNKSDQPSHLTPERVHGGIQ